MIFCCGFWYLSLSSLSASCLSSHWPLSSCIFTHTNTGAPSHPALWPHTQNLEAFPSPFQQQSLFPSGRCTWTRARFLVQIQRGSPTAQRGYFQRLLNSWTLLKGILCHMHMHRAGSFLHPLQLISIDCS